MRTPTTALPTAGATAPARSTGAVLRLLVVLAAFAVLGTVAPGAAAQGGASGPDAPAAASEAAPAAGSEAVDESAGEVVSEPSLAPPTPTPTEAEPPAPVPADEAVIAGLPAGAAVPEGGTTAAAPPVPQNHRIFAGAGAVFQLWDPPANDGGKPIIEYIVERGSDPAFATEHFFAFPALSTSFQWSGLVQGKTYYFRVRARNADGLGTLAPTLSKVIPSSGLPTAPGAVTARPLPESVRGTWAAPSSSGTSALTRYLVRITDIQGLTVRIADLSPASLTVKLDGLTPWTDLFLRVAAVNGTGIGNFSEPVYFAPSRRIEPQCLGTGSDGKRIQVLYAYSGASPSAELLDAADGYTGRIEKMLSESAAATGGVRHYRWVTNNGAPGCDIVITAVPVASNITTFGAMLTALKTAGFDATDRKYFTWVEDQSIPGYLEPCTAQFFNQPGVSDKADDTNVVNTLKFHGVCPLKEGVGFAAAHELMHLMGAVQTTAPHSSSTGHCNQGYDPMCYGTGTVIEPQCLDPFVYSYLFDCGHDDYFNTAPQPGSYLCTHWNTARSQFMTNNREDSTPTQPVGPIATAGNGSATISWSPPNYPSCNPIVGYTITASPGGATVNVGNVTSASFPGLANDTSYTFTVKARVESTFDTTTTDPVIGPESAPTNAITPKNDATTVPGAPTAVNAVPGNQSASVSWTPPASTGGKPINSYRVTANPGGAFISVGNVTTATFPGLTNGTSYTFTVRAGNTNGLSVPSAASPSTVPALQRTYHGLTPARILDSRPEEVTGTVPVPWTSGESRSIQATGVGGVPAGASAVVLNVTAVGAQTNSFLTVWPSGETKPTASNLNFGTGDVIPNLVVVKVGKNGQVSIFNNSGIVHVLADVVGYFDNGDGSGSRFTGVSPKRLLDSRPGADNVGTPPGPFTEGQTRDLTVRGLTPVPADATDVVINMTVTGGTAPSFLTVWPKGQAKPTASNLNFVAGQTIPNLVVVKVGAEDKISIFNSKGNVHVIGDVVGYFSPAGAAFVPVTPARILDSRPGADNVGIYSTPWPANAERFVPVGGQGPVPANAKGVVLNVTVVNASAESFLTVFPEGSAKPNASNLNFLAGKVIPNLVMVPLGTNGRIRIYNSKGTVNVIADVVGYYL